MALNQNHPRRLHALGPMINCLLVAVNLSGFLFHMAAFPRRRGFAAPAAMVNGVRIWPDRRRIGGAPSLLRQGQPHQCCDQNNDCHNVSPLNEGTLKADATRNQVRLTCLSRDRHHRTNHLCGLLPCRRQVRQIYQDQRKSCPCSGSGRDRQQTGQRRQHPRRPARPPW